MGNQSRVNPDSYHTTRSLCDKHDSMSSLDNGTFRIAPRVSYTHVTELFRSHRGSLAPMFKAFHPRGLVVPFLLCPTHIIYIYTTVSLDFGRCPISELTTHSPRMENNSTMNPHPTRRDVTVHMKCMMPMHFPSCYMYI